MIDRLVDAALPADRCCRVLGIARQNYYNAKRTLTTPTQLRLQWLTGLIREVHVASRGTYGYRRVHAELTLGMGITVCERTVCLLMNQAGIYGLPGPTRVKRLRSVATADDLVNRNFHRLRPNECLRPVTTAGRGPLGAPSGVTRGTTRPPRMSCC